jgi:hypothetical protein
MLSGGTVDLLTLDLLGFKPERRLTLRTCVYSIVAEDGGETLVAQSDDAWRYWRAQGVVDGKLMTVMLDDLPRSAAAVVGGDVQAIPAG